MRQKLKRSASVAFALTIFSSILVTIPVTSAATLDWQLGFGTSNKYPYKSVTLASGVSYLVGQANQTGGNLPSDMDCFVSIIQESGQLSTERYFGFEDALCAAVNLSVYDSTRLLISVTRQLAVDTSVYYAELFLIDSSLSSEPVKILSLLGEQLGGAISDASGNIYLTSGSGRYGESMFTRKYSLIGPNTVTLAWQAEYAITTEEAILPYDIALSEQSGQVYVGLDRDRYANSSVVSYQISDGSLAWEHPTTGPVWAVTVDTSTRSESLLVAGPNLNLQDGYVMKLSTSGRVLWQNTISSTQEDYASDVIADSTGQVSVVGVTYGALTGTSNGGIDSFIYTYNANGGLIDQTQFGSTNDESANSLGVDSLGRTYVFGWQNPASKVSSLPLKGAFKQQLLPTSSETNSFLNRFAKVNSKGKSAQPKKPPRR